MNGYKKIIFFSLMVFFTYIGFIIFTELNKEKIPYMILISKVVEDDNDFWNLLIEGAKESSEEYVVQLELMAPNKEGGYQKQEEVIAQAIQKKPDAIILAAEDYEESVASVQKIKHHGIKVTIIDSGIKGRIEDIKVATNNYEAGIKMGYRAKKILINGGIACIIGHTPNTSTAIEREKGIQISLNDIQHQLIPTYWSGGSIKKAYEKTKEVIEMYEDLNVIITLDQYTSIGAARAIKELGRKEGIKIIGVDSSMEQIQYLEEGIFDSLIIQNPFSMGYISVKETTKLLKGKEVKMSVDTGSTVITKENMYRGMNQRLLFPFTE